MCLTSHARTSETFEAIYKNPYILKYELAATHSIHSLFCLVLVKL